MMADIDFFFIFSAGVKGSLLLLMKMKTTWAFNPPSQKHGPVNYVTYPGLALHKNISCCDYFLLDPCKDNGTGGNQHIMPDRTLDMIGMLETR